MEDEKCFICGAVITEDESYNNLVNIKALCDKPVCNECWNNKAFYKYMTIIEKIKDWYNKW